MDCVDQPEATNQTSRLRKTGSGDPEAVSRDVCFEALMWIGRPRSLILAKDDVRFCSDYGLRSAVARCPESADFVAKVFLGWRTKFLRTTDAFRARRREGPHRLSQKRLRTFVRAVRSLAAPEESKNRLSRDFWSRSIFDFCTPLKSRHRRVLFHRRASPH